MKKIPLLVGILCVLTAAYFFQQKTSEGQKSEKIPFIYDRKDFGEVRVRANESVDAIKNEEVRNGWPEDAPAHKCFDLEVRRPLPALEKRARYFYPAFSFVCFVPTFDPGQKDFAAAYPNYSKAIEKLRKLLQRKPTTFRQFEDLFDFPYNNAGWTFKSKIQYLDYPHVAGVFFLTQFSNGMLPSPANNEELTADFQGLTKDEKYYVAAKFSTTNPSLPKGIDFVDKSIQNPPARMTNEEINEYERKYLKKKGEKVDQLGDDSFQPSLQTIKNLIASISTE